MDLKNLRQLFERNISSIQSKARIEILEGYSFRELSRLVTTIGGNDGFDFISVDASHQATDVLSDCVLAFQLLRRGGVMALDDYLWSAESTGNEDILNPRFCIRRSKNG